MSKLILFFRTLIFGILTVWVVYFFTMFPHDVKFLSGKIQCYTQEELEEIKKEAQQDVYTNIR